MSGLFGGDGLPRASGDVVSKSIHAMRHCGGSGIESRYLIGAGSGQFLTTTAPTANVLRAFPFIAPTRAATLDRISVNVTSGVAGNCRVGIYKATSDVNLYPGALVLDSGAISTTSNGVKDVTISQVLEPGTLYWGVHVGDVAPTFRAYYIDGSLVVLGYPAALGTSPQVGLSVSYSYAALPSTFPGSAAAITGEPNVAIFLRFSA